MTTTNFHAQLPPAQAGSARPAAGNPVTTPTGTMCGAS